MNETSNFMNAMNNHYSDSKSGKSFEEGIQFQDFIADELYKIGWIVQNYGSRKYQFNFGENRQQWEIKLDNLCTKTGRFSIEYAEKSKANNKEFVPSGIYGKSLLYIQGNYNIIAIFSTKILRLLHKTKRYKTHEEPTIRAFFLPMEDVEKYAIHIIKIK